MQVQDLRAGLDRRSPVGGELVRRSRDGRMLLARAAAVEAGFEERRHEGLLPGQPTTITCISRPTTDVRDEL
jgi:multidrug resistance efflux pump